MEGKIELPRDVNGVPIKPGDTVYKAPDKTSFVYGESCMTPMKVKSLELMNNSEWWVNIYDRDLGHAPSVLTHVSPDTWKDIENAIDRLIRDARHLGLELSDKQIDKDVAYLMKRINAVVERER